MFNISPLSLSLKKTIQSKIDTKTKPLGSLGRLESLALQIALIQNSESPKINSPEFIVFAGDHGIAEEGVSPYPQEVTVQMVLNFIGGGAAINCFCRQHNIKLSVVDAGVAHPLPVHEGLINCNLGAGTHNFLKEAAMTQTQLKQAFVNAKNLIDTKAKSGCNLVGFGEMGIGNTTSAAAIMAAMLGLSASDCVGRGTGLDDNGLANKVAVLDKALAHHQLDGTDPMAVLATFGGFEVAMIVGAMLAAASNSMVILVDGFIASSAALLACSISPACREYMVFCHQSNEQAHVRLLAALKAEPLLDLGMRLGEGSGAAVAYPLIESAVGFLNEMSSFESAGVSNK